MRDINIGDIYEVDVAFTDIPHRSKVRPVMIIGIEDEYITIVIITTKGPNNPPKFFDRFRLPVVDWSYANLDKPSYFRVNKIKNIEYEALYKYIGTASVDDIKTAYDGVIAMRKILTHR